MIQQNEKLNNELKDFINCFQKTNDCTKLEKNFRKILPLLKIKKFRDPSGVLTYEDFESFALQGFWKACRKYKPEVSDNVIFWVIKLVRQRIAKEIRVINKKSKDIINSHIDPDLNIYNLGEDEPMTQNPLNVPEFFERDLFNLNELIFEVSPKASYILQLKIAFPEMDRTSIAIVLGLKRRTGVSKLIKIIRTVTQNQLDEEILDSIK